MVTNRREVYMLTYLPVLTGPLVVMALGLTGALVQALHNPRH